MSYIKDIVGRIKYKFRERLGGIGKESLNDVTLGAGSVLPAGRVIHFSPVFLTILSSHSAISVMSFAEA